MASADLIASKPVRVALLDTETTGLSRSDEPISIGVILMEVNPEDGQIIRELDVYHGLREPRVPINPFAARVHGLTLRELRGKRWDTQRLGSIARTAQIVVAHNASFDRRMLAPVARDFRNVNWTCSIDALKPEWTQITGGRTSLDAICSALGIHRPAVHDALADCRSLQAALSHRPFPSHPERLMRRLVDRSAMC